MTSGPLLNVFVIWCDELCLKAIALFIPENGQCPEQALEWYWAFILNDGPWPLFPVHNPHARID